jgi:hypothetical protein
VLWIKAPSASTPKRSGCCYCALSVDWWVRTLRRVNLEVVVPKGVEAMLPCIEDHQLRLERDGEENGHDLPRSRKAYSPYCPKKLKQIRSWRNPDAQYSSPKIRECGGSKDFQQSIVSPPPTNSECYMPHPEALLHQNSVDHI